MKVLLSILLVIFFTIKCNAQILSVPVGEVSFVYRPPSDTIYTYKDCGVDGVFRHDVCRNHIWGVEDTIRPFFTKVPAIWCRPESAGHFYDTVMFLISDLDEGKNTYCFSHPCGEFPKKNLSINAFYDDKIRMSSYHPWQLGDDPYDSTVVLGYDTLRRQYASNVIPFFIYNNKSDSTEVDSFKLDTDPSLKLTFTPLIDTTLTSHFEVGAFSSRKNFNIIFFSEHSPFLVYTNVTGLLTCHFKFAGKDSVYNIPLRFTFIPIQGSGISINFLHNAIISAYPNPSSGLIQVTLTMQKASSIHLHLFNELGQDIMTVYDGMIPEGKRDFSFKLPQGMYYVRMETAEGVVTKKIVVE